MTPIGGDAIAICPVPVRFSRPGVAVTEGLDSRDAQQRCVEAHHPTLSRNRLDACGPEPSVSREHGSSQESRRVPQHPLDGSGRMLGFPAWWRR